MSVRLEADGYCLGVPHDDRRVNAACEMLAVGAEDQRVDTSRLCQDLCRSRGSHVPDLDGVVFRLAYRGRRDTRAIRTQGQRGDGPTMA